MPPRIKPRFAAALALCATTLALLLLKSGPMPQEPSFKTRSPRFAGSFYPADKASLERTVSELLAQAQAKQGPTHPVAPKVLIVPHAGYQYSGSTAALAYASLLPHASKIKRVVLLAPSHRIYLESALVIAASYASPVGTLPLDTDAISLLRTQGHIAINTDIRPLDNEHSDEVQIPFLLKALPHAKLVPVIVGHCEKLEILDVAHALAPIIDEHTLIVASSDFTHFGKDFDYTPKLTGKDRKEGLHLLDHGAIQKILAFDRAGFAQYVGDQHATICGHAPIELALELLRRSRNTQHATELGYTTSGEVTGDWEHSVSYAAIALGSLEISAASSAESDSHRKPTIEKKYLSSENERALLKLARSVLTQLSAKGAREAIQSNPELEQKLGVFVTLTKNGELRGCIGHIQGDAPLIDGVIENTLNAALEDPRFPSVTREEATSLHIEISVMTPLTRLQDPLQEGAIVIGRDGLVLKNGGRSGVFLPQVPLDWSWDKITYLEQLGRKAGLNSNAYKDPKTELYRFSAQVFEE